VDAEELKKRTQIFAIKVIRLVRSLSCQGHSGIIGRQLLRCGTSIGANYRAACRAKSRADFISKLKTVEEECDESIYWMELLVASYIGNSHEIEMLMREAAQILSIIVSSIQTARAHIQNP
jgi:four helix bundle protein